MKHPGIKRPFFPLPTNDEITDYACVQLSIPDRDDYRIALFSCLTLLTQWFNWERDTAQRGAIVAGIWREVIENMAWQNACCGDGTPELQRFDEFGNLEVSNDGGETWTSGAGIDGRFNSPLLAPLPGTAEQKRCNTAFGISSFLQSTIYDNLATVSGAAQLVVLIGSALALVASGGAAYPLVTALSGTILTTGIGAIEAALTTEVWDTFACLIYCRLDDAGNMTAENWTALQSDVNEEFTGVVALVLIGTVQAFGPVGMTNAGRSMSLTAIDCSACDCTWTEYFLGGYGLRGLELTPWPTSNFCTGTYSGDELIGCCGGNGTGMRVRASLDFAEANIKRVIMHTETNATAASSGDEQLIYNGLVEIITVGTPTGIATTTVDSGPIDIMSGELIFRVSAAIGGNCATTSAYSRIVLIEITGEGFNPFTGT